MFVALFDTHVGANYENDGEISKYETRVTTSLPCGIPFEVTVKEDNDCWKIKFHRHINHGKISLFHLLHMINLPIRIFIWNLPQLFHHISSDHARCLKMRSISKFYFGLLGIQLQLYTNNFNGKKGPLPSLRLADTIYQRKEKRGKENISFCTRRW